MTDKLKELHEEKASMQRHLDLIIAREHPDISAEFKKKCINCLRCALANKEIEIAQFEKWTTAGSNIVKPMVGMEAHND